VISLGHRVRVKMKRFCRVSNRPAPTDETAATIRTSPSQILSSIVTLIPAFTEFTEWKGHWCMFVLISSFSSLLATCARLSWILSFRVYVVHSRFAGTRFAESWKVHSMSKCSCFMKKSYSVIMRLRNIPSMQHYVLLIITTLKAA